MGLIPVLISPIQYRSLAPDKRVDRGVKASDGVPKPETRNSPVTIFMHAKCPKAWRGFFQIRGRIQNCHSLAKR